MANISGKKQAVLYIIFMLFCCGKLAAQHHTPEKPMTRLAVLHIHPEQLDAYNIMLKEQITTALRLEPGVLSYQAMADKKDPAKITIVEVYASKAAYEAHIAAPHFVKYKNGTLHMIKSLELSEVDILISGSKETGPLKEMH